MKEITVISGKGGTGKTSLSAALAALMGKGAVVTDCDVDAANMHILMKPVVHDEQPFKSGSEAVINPEACTRCGKCKKVCRFDAISIVNQAYTVDSIACEGCGYCANICPANAIVMEPIVAGTLFRSTSQYQNSFVHARLGIAADNSGKLVTEVRNRAKKLAQDTGVDYLLHDGAPGVGCPVTASVTGADYILMIAEPSVSGSHDVKRVYELVKQFSIPAGMIINKQGLNPEIEQELEHFCAEKKIDFIGTLPYSSDFSKAINANQTIVEYSPVLKEKMEHIFAHLKQKIETISA
jgi:MinD superfamily P-loop ATPase